MGAMGCVGFPMGFPVGSVGFPMGYPMGSVVITSVFHGMSVLIVYL